MAPVTTATIVFGKSLAGSAFGVVLSLVTAIGAMLLTGGAIINPFLFALAVIVGSFAFSALGMLVAAAVKDMPTANISLTAIRLPMIFIGGVFQPVEASPLQLRIISYLTPLSYLVDALREAMVATSIIFVVDLVAMLTWFIVLQMLAIMVLNKRLA
jgi:ABC-2 type transport system permease protein